MVLISTSTAPALCPCAVLVRYWANGQSGFKKGREGVYLEIERCLARPQETAISEGQPPSTPPSSLERERRCGSWKRQQAMPASLVHTRAQTTLPIIQPSSSWTVAHRAVVLLPASADDAGSAIYRGSDPIFFGSWWKGGKLFPFRNSRLALPSPCSPGAPASPCYINQGLVSPD